MNTTQYLSTFGLIAASVLAVSCVNNEEYSAPASQATAQTTNATFANLVSWKPAAIGSQISLTDDKTIPAYVVSSDEAGNIYKTIQVVSEDGKWGAQINVDRSNNYADYPAGSKVYIKTKGLTLGNTYSMVDLGTINNGNVGRIPYALVSNYVQAGEKTSLTEENLVQTKNAAGNPLTLSDINNDAYLNRLVEVDNVQIAAPFVGTTYYDKTNDSGSATNVFMEDDKNNLIARMSSYATFANQQLPTGNGKIRGILTKYNNDYQFLIRNPNDLKFTGTRKTQYHKATIGANSTTFPTSINETFSPSSNISKYVLYEDSGFINWAIASNQLQMSAYKTGNYTRSYFIVPVNFTGSNKLSFDVAVNYYNGSALKVYTTTQYDPQNPLDRSKLTEITNNFSLPKLPTNANGSMASAGSYTLAGLSGNGYIVFEYSGSSTDITTTVRIDNIKVQ